MAIGSLSLPAPRGSATATCHSSCTKQLAECKRTCPGGGPGRRDCRAACADRSTCTAPGARIRTLAYVVSECTTDPQGRSSLRQKLLVRRGNCDPVTVMESAASTPVPFGASTLVPFGQTNCRVWGEKRIGSFFPLAVGVFQRTGVLPDGSGVLFEVTKEFSPVRDLIPGPLEEGIFFVRADGSGLRRLGPASRFPSLAPLDTGHAFSVSPDGRRIAFIDLGPDTPGHEGFVSRSSVWPPQIFLLELRSGRRTQLTHQSQVASLAEQPIRFARFLDSRTIGFFSGTPELDTPLKSYRVKTDGSGYEEIPGPTLVEGARVSSQFAITGGRPQIILVSFPDRQPVNPRPAFPAVFELFLSDGKKLLQLTDFGRDDTAFGGFFVARGRVFFNASADLGENPAEICQLFSMNTFGGDLRQLTHLPSDGRPPPYSGCDLWGRACAIDFLSLVPDRVTGTVLFQSSCDPVGRNPYGSQFFAMRPDGSGLRQLTATRGMMTDPDGTVHVEMPGQLAYSSFGEF